MTQLFTLPQQVRINSSGSPYANAQAFFYRINTVTAQTVYADPGLVSPHENPVQANSDGQFPAIWLDSSAVYDYRVIIKTQPGATLDDYPITILRPNQADIGLALHPRTAAEIAAGVTPTNYAYFEGDVRRYGADPTGAADSTTPFANAILVASQNLGPVISIPSGLFKITSTLVVAAGKQVTIKGAGKFLSILYITGFSSGQYAIDYQGTFGSRIEAIQCRDLAVWSTNGLGCAFKMTWVINSAFEHLYYYDLEDGCVLSSSFGNSFYDTNSYSISGSNYLLQVDTANNTFLKSRFIGGTGINVVSTCDSLDVIGCDFEGVSTAIALIPATGTKVSGINIIGNHFENVNGSAVYCDGADADSVQALLVRGNKISGGFGALGNTSAINAIRVKNVKGFDISLNDVTDYGTQDATGGGTQGYMVSQIANASNGSIKNNTSVLGGGLTLTLQNVADATPGTSIEVANNWVPVNGTGFKGYAVAYQNPSRVTISVAGGGTATCDASTGYFFDITATGNFTFANPPNTVTGKPILARIKNTSGGALVITWGGLIKQNFTAPANGQNRTIELTSDGTNFIHTGGTFADVPN